MPPATRQFVGRAIGFAFIAVLMRLAAPPLPPLHVVFVGLSLVSVLVAVFLLVVAAAAWGVVLGREQELDPSSRGDR